MVHVPPAGCCVTARNVTPLGAASASVTLCAWFGPLFRTRTVYAMSACPLTSCTCAVASLITWTSMNSSVGGATVGGTIGGGVVPHVTVTLAESVSST